MEQALSKSPQVLRHEPNLPMRQQDTANKPFQKVVNVKISNIEGYHRFARPAGISSAAALRACSMATGLFCACVMQAVRPYGSPQIHADLGRIDPFSDPAKLQGGLVTQVACQKEGGHSQPVGTHIDQPPGERRAPPRMVGMIRKEC
jgi:hypothetical protein